MKNEHVRTIVKTWFADESSVLCSTIAQELEILPKQVVEAFSEFQPPLLVAGSNVASASRTEKRQRARLRDAIETIVGRTPLEVTIGTESERVPMPKTAEISGWQFVFCRIAEACVTKGLKVPCYVGNSLVLSHNNAKDLGERPKKLRLGPGDIYASTNRSAKNLATLALELCAEAGINPDDVYVTFE